MSKIDYDKAYEYFLGVASKEDLVNATAYDIFLDGVGYGMSLMEEKEDEGKHYYFTSNTLGLVVENFYKTREEAERGIQSTAEVGNILGELFVPKISEIEEREGSIEENYSLLPNGEKITESEANEWAEGLLKEDK